MGIFAPALTQRSEVDPIVWTNFCLSLDGEAADQDGGPETAIHSGLDSALGSHPCVALPSYQAFPVYGSSCNQKRKNIHSGKQQR
jgi:hypothetical protein